MKLRVFIFTIPIALLIAVAPVVGESTLDWIPEWFGSSADQELVSDITPESYAGEAPAEQPVFVEYADKNASDYDPRNEDMVFLPRETHPWVFSKGEQGEFMKLSKDEAMKYYTEFQKVSAERDLTENTFLLASMINILNNYQFKIGEFFPEKNKTEDFLKCQINRDRDFVAVVEFIDAEEELKKPEDQRRSPGIKLMKLGVCQRFFEKYWSGNVPAYWNVRDAGKSLFSFVMTLSGRSRSKAERMVRFER